MDNSRSKSRIPIVGPALALVAAVGAGAIYLGSDGNLWGNPIATNNTAPPPAEGSTLVNDPADPNMRRITLLMDGWSAQTVKSARLTYVPDADLRGINNEPKTKSLVLSPVSESDLGALAKDTPEILERAAARMVTAAADLECTTSGCSAGGAKLPFSYFTDPASIPTYGPSYEGYGVEGVLYKADILVPKDTSNLQLNGTDYTSYTVNVGVPVEGADVEGEEVAPGAINGYDQDRFFVGAAFGRFFVPTPEWILEGDDLTVPALPYAQDPVDETSPDTTVLTKYQEGPLFAGGLAVPVPEALDLGDSKVTYMSSPTIGCGPGVTCVPGEVEVTFDRPEESDTMRVCPADGSAGEARMLTQVSYWSVNYPAPTHQFGVWDGLTVDKLEGYSADDRGLLGGGAPVLVDGAQSLRVANTLFFTNLDQPRLWDAIGYVAQEGKDAPEAFTVTYGPDNLAELQGGYFKTC